MSQMQLCTVLQYGHVLLKHWVLAAPFASSSNCKIFSTSEIRHWANFIFLIFLLLKFHLNWGFIVVFSLDNILKSISESSLYNGVERKWLGIKITVWTWILSIFVEFQTQCTERSVKNNGLDCFALSMIRFPKETGRKVQFIWQAIPDNRNDSFPWHPIALYRTKCKCQYSLKSLRYS